MLYRATEPRPVPDAAQAPHHADQTRIYDLLRQTLLTNPTSVPAWLSLSTVVENRTHQRDCLERVLALDSQNQTARDRLEHLRLQELLASMRAPVLRDCSVAARPLGRQLVEQALITDQQLHAALREQRQRRQRGVFVPLGELLLAWGWIAPPTLAHALVVQLEEKIALHPGHAPQFLGEYLIAEGLLTLRQLAELLAEQIQLRLAGQHSPLGQLLIQKGVLSAPTLQRMLDDQRAAFYSSMGD